MHLRLHRRGAKQRASLFLLLMTMSSLLAVILSVGGSGFDSRRALKEWRTECVFRVQHDKWGVVCSEARSLVSFRARLVWTMRGADEWQGLRIWRQ